MQQDLAKADLTSIGTMWPLRGGASASNPRDEKVAYGFMIMLVEDLFAHEPDRKRFEGALSRVSKWFKGSLIVTGSAAVEWNLVKSSQARVGELILKDIDLVAANGIADLRPGITEDFDVLHFHPYREKGKILIQLWDRETSIRIDIFTPCEPSVMTRVTRASSGRTEVGIISAEDLAARLLAISASLIEGRPTDPKYIRNLLRLVGVTDRPLAGKLWPHYTRRGLPCEFETAFAMVTAAAVSHSELLRPDIYLDQPDEFCEHCIPAEELETLSKSEAMQAKEIQ
jgi:hypothetical protein